MKRKDGLTWFIVVIGVFVLITCTTFVPRANAQDYRPDTSAYAQQFEEIFRFVQEYYVDETDPDVLFQGAIKGLLESLGDPRSVYLSSNELNSLNDKMTGEFGGVGLYISKSTTNLRSADNPYGKLPYVEVIAPIEGTPAYRAGIKGGDYIYKVEGKSTEDQTLDEVVDQLRGPSGSSVEVTILQHGRVEREITLTRAIIEVPTEKHAMLPGDLGYIRIINWTPYTADRMTAALDELKSAGMKGLVIDVRGNPGGLLTSATNTSDLFLDHGTIVSTKGRYPEDTRYFSATNTTAIGSNVPMVVLIDGGSASASEIFSGAMKDNNRAELVGSTSYGKGSVQNVYNFDDWGFKLTTSRYYTPSGVNIDKVGIEPDVVVDDTLSDADQEALVQLLEENRIAEFIDENPNPTDQQVNVFIQQLADDGINLDGWFIKKLVKDERNRYLQDPPVFDLEFDRTLQKAVDVLKGML